MGRRAAFTLLLALVLAAPASAFVHTRVVYVPAAGGTPKTLWTLPGRFASFNDAHWTADGTVVGLQDGYTVKALTVGGGKTSLKHLGGEYNAISVDGRAVTQLATKCRLSVRFFEGRRLFQRRLCRHVYGEFFEGMEFSRDGSRLAVLIKDRPHLRHLFVLDATTGRTLAKTPLKGIRFLNANPFDATGGHVLVSGGQVHALDVDSGRLRRLDAGRLDYAVYGPGRIVAGFGIYSEGAAFGPPFTHSGHNPGTRGISAVAWDPSGTSVLVGFGGRLDRVSVPGQPKTQSMLADLGKGYITSIVPSPDGSGIVAVVTEDES